MMQNNNKEFEAKQPDMKVDGIAIWFKLDKNGNEMGTVRIVGHNPIYVFKNVPRIKEEQIV